MAISVIIRDVVRPYFAILFLAGGIALGQNPPLPLPQGVRPVAQDPAVKGMPVRLQFPNTDVKEVLGFYELLTKKRLTLDILQKIDQVSGSQAFHGVRERHSNLRFFVNEICSGRTVQLTPL
jgi:hypothetical protein